MAQKKYECMYITDVQQSEEDYNEVIQLLQTLINDNNGKVESNVDLGTRRLAYLIEKRTHGRYGLLTFTAKKETIDALNKRLSYEDKLVRYMITKIEH